MIECENLVKIYKTIDTEVLALQGLELTVEDGELMAIIGNSGSGKSTFLNMIGGLDRPSAGRLIVNGLDLFKLSEAELVAYKRDVVGFVWQNNARNLVPYLTAIENVRMPMMFGTIKQQKERAAELLEMVGMSHRAKNKLSMLSGGEQQRIAIARSLLNRPKLIIADEPTGNLDNETADGILRLLTGINQEDGTAIIMVTHNRNIFEKYHGRIFVCKDEKCEENVNDEVIDLALTI